MSAERRNPPATPRKTQEPAPLATIIGGLVDVAARPSKASATALLSLALRSVKPRKTLEAAVAMLPLIGIGLRPRRRRSETQSVLGICAFLARKHLETARAAITDLAHAASKPDAAVPNHAASPDTPARPVSSERIDVDARQNDIGSSDDSRRGSSPAAGSGTLPTLKPRATTPVNDVAHGPTRRSRGAGPQVMPSATQKLALTVLHAGPVETRLDDITGRNSRSGSQFDASRPDDAPHKADKPGRRPDESAAKVPERTDRETMQGREPAALVATPTMADVLRRPEPARPHMTPGAPSHPASRDEKPSRPDKPASETSSGSGNLRPGPPSAQTARSGPRDASPSQDKLAVLYAAALYKDRRWRHEWSAELATAFGPDAESWDRRIEAEYRRLFVETDISAAEVKKLAKAEATAAGAAVRGRASDADRR